MKGQIELLIEHQNCEPIDLEWLKLILEAKKNGLTTNEVRNFFQEADTDNRKDNQTSF
ncbi:anti-repressor SinI family protein [Ectobacillus panaciterrae]|uniref:anti-repressor SinI family protein n=1 Tax=Ectobacillus panaciterrae TaxID=363872 RepID=UPI0004078B13|nr:anti-repressor SinI family protein [Ectobacillus panaciterrae]